MFNPVKLIIPLLVILVIVSSLFWLGMLSARPRWIAPLALGFMTLLLLVSLFYLRGAAQFSVLTLGIVLNVASALFFTKKMTDSINSWALVDAPVAPEIHALKIEIERLPQDGAEITRALLKLRIHNKSTHDFFFLGNPPSNVFYRIDTFDSRTSSWTLQKRAYNRMKTGLHLLERDKAFDLDINEAPAIQEKVIDAKNVRIGLLVKWNPSQPKLFLHAAENPALEEGYIFFELSLKYP